MPFELIDYEPATSAIKCLQQLSDVCLEKFQRRSIVVSRQSTGNAIAAPTAAVPSMVSIGKSERTIKCRLVLKQDNQGPTFVTDLGLQKAL
jgi:hypothetical protein